MVASASADQELKLLTQLNPEINVVVYTLDFKVAASMQNTLQELGLADVETIQVSVAKLGSNNTFKQQPAPWIISAKSRV